MSARGLPGSRWAAKRAGMMAARRTSRCNPAPIRFATPILRVGTLRPLPALAGQLLQYSALARSVRVNRDGMSVLDDIRHAAFELRQTDPQEAIRILRK